MMAAGWLRKTVVQPWLGLSRQWTLRGLRKRLRHRAATPQYEPVPESLLYVAASSRPYHLSGYTMRTHEVVRALSAAGGQVSVLTRPGYPWDRRDRLQNPEDQETVLNGVRYQHAPAPLNKIPVLQYAIRAAETIAQVAQQHQVAVIHAASNHVNALPALLAARRLGVPFQYEMRGLWELTRASRMPQFLNSQGYRQGLQLEAMVATQADKLFVISEQLGAYVREHWGVEAERIELLPNCIDPDRFVEMPEVEVKPNTIGYAGTLIGYEGLDTLIQAVAILVEQDQPIQVRLLGDGEAMESLEQQVQALGLQEYIHFLGRMPPEQVQTVLAGCSLICLPRKPFQVCEIVPPLKLVEALAMKKPVIVPDLPVFRDELGESRSGWFFRAGDAVDLARVVREAFSDSDELRLRGEHAKAHALAQRSWHDFVLNVLPDSDMGRVS